MSNKRKGTLDALWSPSKKQKMIDTKEAMLIIKSTIIQ